MASGFGNEAQIDAEVAALDVTAQFDAFPDAQQAEDTLDLGIAALGSLDFSNPVESCLMLRLIRRHCPPWSILSALLRIRPQKMRRYHSHCILYGAPCKDRFYVSRSDTFADPHAPASLTLQCHKAQLIGNGQPCDRASSSWSGWDRHTHSSCCLCRQRDSRTCLNPYPPQKEHRGKTRERDRTYGPKSLKERIYE